MIILAPVLREVALYLLSWFKPLKKVLVTNFRAFLGFGSFELQAFLTVFVVSSYFLFNFRPADLILSLQDHLGITAMSDVEIFQHLGS